MGFKDIVLYIIYIYRFIIVGFYGSLYIPNSFFEYYVDLSSIISGGYMLFQIIIYIDIFYKWAENWVK